MSTGTYCVTCRKYIDLPEQPVDERWRCKCAKPIRSDGKVGSSSESDCDDCIPSGHETGWNPSSERWCSCDRGIRAREAAWAELPWGKERRGQS